MGGLKLWDGSAWRTISAVPGRQGPQGPISTDFNPRGPAGGGLNGEYPNPGVNRTAAGTLLDVQRDWDTQSALSWTAIANNAALPLSITYTPTVPCWWVVNCATTFQNTVAAYYYAYLGLFITPADQDGLTVQRTIETQYNGVQSFCWRLNKMMWRLAANTTYTTFARLDNASGGTWQYLGGYASTWMDTKAFAQ